MATSLKRTHDHLETTQAKPARYAGSSDEETDELEETPDRLDESGETLSQDEDECVADDVLDDIQRFETHFHNISQRYRLINRIGEGTFSTVYKAEDLLYDQYQNQWDDPSGYGKTSRSQKSRFVAIKKIYVTSSPQRIFNELDLLNDLRDAPNVCPLITAMRCLDQVVAVLPFFPHIDFREYYRDLSIEDMQVYFISLFTALRSVHEKRIMHRDIKPTNFLYSPTQRKGVLVDFGLAEREGTEYHACPCVYEERDRNKRINSSVHATSLRAAHTAGTSIRPMYPSNDQRSSRRANRAGTRGFRAPEVLLKCTAQTCAIDIWSCGIILLTFLSHRFPFFHSADDIDAFIELCAIFGKQRMRDTALLHGQVLHTNIPTISDSGHSWEKVILWCLHREKKNSAGEGGLSDEEAEAVKFMALCLELDPKKRITASEALKHPWLAGVAREMSG
ncbi:hypothetical protein AMS68_002061 [Peltaster fructicola]|uniref:non-specific serine/threonine protein kinase n=1 Tax=Peltaster fructicola TaxID=286661 RepID=A0A6H0XP91_9PEZI|nr:hypothetical protein AMS68_002061 [Peltaster fructicola]